MELRIMFKKKKKDKMSVSRLEIEEIELVLFKFN